MSDRCEQEMCPHWTGDGRVCACVMFDLTPPHDFAPGVDTDMVSEGRSPDPTWCNVCGEPRAQHIAGGV